MSHPQLKKLEVLKSDGKSYYVMNIKKQWYALALEDFQVTFLQQYISPKAFNLKVNSNKLKEATQTITAYDFTTFDDDQLIHMFFDRQKPYEETTYQSTPSHLEQKCADDRTIQSNEEFARMSPYNFTKKQDHHIYYVMKVKNKLHAVALEMHQVKFLKENIKANIFNCPKNAEQIEASNKEIQTYNFTNLENESLLNIFKSR